MLAGVVHSRELVQHRQSIGNRSGRFGLCRNLVLDLWKVDMLCSLKYSEACFLSFYRKLRSSLSDPHVLKRLSGDWFSDVRARRPWGQVGGVDIVRASIRRKKKTRGGS